MVVLQVNYYKKMKALLKC